MAGGGRGEEEGFQSPLMAVGNKGMRMSFSAGEGQLYATTHVVREGVAPARLTLRNG